MTTSTYKIKIGDIGIDVIRKEIKNLHLAVYPPNGRVRIAAPLRVDDESVRLFGVSKIPWIKKQKSKYENQQRETKREYITGESHYLFGKRYLLKVAEENKPARVEIKGKHIYLFVRPNSTQLSLEEIVTEWYRSELKKHIPALIEKWQQVTAVKATEWRVKRMKTRWGTCNKKINRIWLNLELAKKPEHCLEYIIVHELVHLLEKNHTDQFKVRMDKFIPQWRAYREELNRLILNHQDWDY